MHNDIQYHDLNVLYINGYHKLISRCEPNYALVCEPVKYLQKERDV